MSFFTADTSGLGVSSHNAPRASSVSGEDTQQAHLLQSMLSMGAEQNEEPEGRDIYYK